MRLPHTIALCLLAFGSDAMTQEDAPSSQSDQQRILTLMRQFVASYKMPDVAYDQATTFFSQPGMPTLYSQRICHDGHEYLCCRIGKNGKKAPGEWQEAFTPAYGALYPWAKDSVTTTRSRWETLRLHRLAVF